MICPGSSNDENIVSSEGDDVYCYFAACEDIGMLYEFIPVSAIANVLLCLHMTNFILQIMSRSPVLLGAADTLILQDATHWSSFTHIDYLFPQRAALIGPIRPFPAGKPMPV